MNSNGAPAKMIKTHSGSMDSSLFRKIPQLNELLCEPPVAALEQAWSREEIVAALRIVLDNVRNDVRMGSPLPDFASNDFANKIRTELHQRREPSLRPIINATGIVIHTNLGRAPLAPSALKAIEETARGYTNIEMTLATGKRGSRYDHVRELLRELTGAEDAIVVNNCAAAVTLCLATLAKGREVIVSRGELIEIGGSFRIPDIVTQNGAVLREVGTTNKTKLSDYETAVNEHTAVLLKTHTSNYRIIGFTAKPSVKELSELAEAQKLNFIEDLGSGTLIDLSEYGIADEPTVAQRIAQGVHLVTFSGDKLLGGPQCGIIAGKAHLIDRLKSNPLLRAMRIDKLSLAALEATLRLYKPPHVAENDVPVLRMLTTAKEDLEKAAQEFAKQINPMDHMTCRVEELDSEAGGGSLPGTALPSFGVRLRCDHLSTTEFATALRASKPPIIARVSGGDVVMDMRTIAESERAHVLAALAAITPSSVSE